MCNKSKSQTQSIIAEKQLEASALPTSITEKAEPSIILSYLWPVHPICIALIAPFLPSSLYLNRGYTVWYHHFTVLYLLTNIEALRTFIIIQGSGICLGWWAAFANDFLRNGRFAHILYMNMPPSIKATMFDPAKNQVFYTDESMKWMAISHVLDTLLHPGIVVMLLKVHFASTPATDGKSNFMKRWAEIITWQNIVASFCVSRVWSIVHTYHNTGKAELWYFGYDVYHIHSLDSWLPAYIAEGAFLASLIIWKLGFQKSA